MNIGVKELREKTYSIKVYEEELRMIRYLNSISKRRLPDMLRNYIRELYEKEMNISREIDPDKDVYGL